MARVTRLAKLRTMSAHEILGRMRYQAFTACERALYWRGLLARPDRLRRGLVPELARAADWQEALLRRERAGAFFASLDDPGALRARFAAGYGEEIQKARRVADAVARHEIEFFGERFSFGAHVDWHADPVTKARWPRTYHRDVPVGGGDRGFGDVKYVWELNRHQFLIDLAKIVLLDGSDRHRQALQTLIEDWHRDVPYATGAPWACALEPAFRLWSWLWAYHLARAAGPLDSSLHIVWLRGLFDHGRFLYRHLETYSSPYNHLIGEASALFAVGVLFPEFKEASAWAARGRRVLESTVAGQFNADGGTVEQSTFYHHATLGFYLLAAILGQRNGIHLSAEVWGAIERGIDFSVTLVQPDGRLPSIGGADDGKPIRLEHLPFWDFRPYYAMGAVLFERGDFKAAAERFWEDAMWVLGPDALQGFLALPPEEPAVSRTLSDSGYSVFRSHWSTEADYVCFDCGPQAAGLRRDDVPSAAHGHADCLSVVATLGGQPVLVDPGFYCYNGPPEWELHFRKTAAHNTVSIDGRDQARHMSKMSWARTYEARLEEASLSDAIGWARGSHDGYEDGGSGVLHTRTVWLRPGGYLMIVDEIAARRGHAARANFQFAPGTLVLEREETALFSSRFELVWACSVPVIPTVVQDGESPDGGWVATSLGVRRRAPRLALDFNVPAGRAVLLTLLADRKRTGDETAGRIAALWSLPGQSAAALAARVAGRGWEDYVIATLGARTLPWPGIETDAPVAVVRVTGRGVEDARRVGGSHLRVDGHRFRVAEQGHEAEMASTRSSGGK